MKYGLDKSGKLKSYHQKKHTKYIDGLTNEAEKNRHRLMTSHFVWMIIFFLSLVVVDRFLAIELANNTGSEYAFIILIYLSSAVIWDNLIGIKFI